MSLAERVKQIAEDKISFSGIGIYVNPLQYEGQRQAVEKCIDSARLFGANIVSTFAGAIEGASVPEAMGAYQKIRRVVRTTLLRPQVSGNGGFRLEKNHAAVIGMQLPGRHCNRRLS